MPNGPDILQFHRKFPTNPQFFYSFLPLLFNNFHKPERKLVVEIIESLVQKKKSFHNKKQSHGSALSTDKGKKKYQFETGKYI